jgi:hypothetical protein
MSDLKSQISDSRLRSANPQSAIRNSQSKVIVVLQPGYLPWLGFFDQMRRADIFVYYDDVQFDKHGWRNRNRIKSPDGAHWLTVPVRRARLDQRILDVEIDNRAAWARKHVGSIRQFYASAPFLDRYLPELAALLERRWKLIVDLDLAVAQNGWGCRSVRLCAPQSWALQAREASAC